MCHKIHLFNCHFKVLVIWNTIKVKSLPNITKLMCSFWEIVFCVDPGPTWSVLHPGVPPLLVPLSSCTGGYGPHPRRLIRTPVQGGYPRYHSILSPPRRASLLVPLPLDLSASLPPEFCPLPFVCFLCGTWHRALIRKHCQLEEFINVKKLSSYDRAPT